MKLRVGTLIVLVLLVCTGMLSAQEDSVWVPRLELSGSFLYSESTVPLTDYFGYDYKSSTYTWAIQPGVGLFIVGYLELGVNIRYQRTRTETEHPATRGIPHRDYYTSTSSLIVSLGPGYNLPLGRRAWLYLQLKAGLYWTANGEGSGLEETPKWSGNQSVFPIVQGGFKFFLSARSALIVQLQYDRLSKEKERTTTFGMGLASYL